MFEIPDWEGDISKTDVNFVEINKDNKIKSKEVQEKAVVVKNCSPKALGQKLFNGATKSNYVMKNGNEKIKPNFHKNNQQIEKQKKNHKKEKQPIKHKLPDNNIANTKKKKFLKPHKIEQIYDTDKPDEILLNAGKKKLDEQIQSDDSEELLFNGQKSKDVQEKAVVVMNCSPKALAQKLFNGATKSNYVMKNGNEKIEPNFHKNNQQIEKQKKNHKKEKQPIKHKLPDNNIANTKKKKFSKPQEIEQIYDTDKPDEILLNAGKKKLDEQIQSDDSEELLFNGQEQNKNSKQSKICKIYSEITKPLKSPCTPKVAKKKLVIQSILHKENPRRHIDISRNGNKLRERMMERLKAAQFRYLNEKLYTTSGTEAQKLFQADPVAFHTYHEGYQQQVKKWPVKPLDIIVKKITKMPKSHLVADMGCGEAELSDRVVQKVRSFDLVAASDNVETCDMAHTPLLSASMDVVVYCLALMGTNLTQYLVEANRVLKVGGYLLIAEVESRFDDVEAFAKEVLRLGFKLKELDKSNQVFFFMEFIKTQAPPVKKSKLPELTLKPCLYKRR